MLTPKQSTISLALPIEPHAVNRIPITVITWDIHWIVVDNHEIVSQHEIMPRLSRIMVPGHPHHVSQRRVRSMNVFHEESDRREYLGMPGEEIIRHGDAGFAPQVD